MGRAGDGDGAAGVGRDVGADGFVVAKGQVERAARLLAVVFQMHGKACGFTGENRIGSPRHEAQGDQIVKGVHHRHHAEPAEQENQRMAKAEVVVDRANQHQDQDDGKQQAGFCRNDEDPALGEHNGKLLIAAKAE